jgi:hypothetical protein
LTNLFFSISPEEYYKPWQDEIWGCVNYIKGMSYETVMGMPVYKRKYWILKHNAEQKAQEEAYEASKNGGRTASVGGSAINSYAEIEQGAKK